jgi:hypothetical protein
MTNVAAEEAGVEVGPGRDSQAVDPARAPGAAGSGMAPGDPPPPLSSLEYSVAFTPRNVAIGLAIVAGIVAFALSRRRRRDDAPADEVD